MNERINDPMHKVSVSWIRTQADRLVAEGSISSRLEGKSTHYACLPLPTKPIYTDVYLQDAQIDGYQVWRQDPGQVRHRILAQGLDEEEARVCVQALNGLAQTRLQRAKTADTLRQMAKDVGASPKAAEAAVALHHKNTTHAEANAPETNLWVIRVLAKGQRFSNARRPGYIAAYYSNDTSSWWLLKASAVDRLAHELLNGKDNEPATQRAALQQWEEQISSGDEMLELSWREALDYKLPSGGVIEQEAVKQPVRAAKAPQT